MSGAALAVYSAVLAAAVVAVWRRPAIALYLFILGLPLHNIVMSLLYGGGVRGHALDAIQAWKEMGLIFTFSGVTFAQQPESAPQDNRQQQERLERRGGRHGMGKRGGVLRLLSRLDLTDAQRQQVRSVEERFEAATKSQREELRSLHEGSQTTPSASTDARAQALRSEIGQAIRGMHQELLNILTNEQRTQLEQLIKERKARHMERRGQGIDQQNDDQ